MYGYGLLHIPFLSGLSGSAVAEADDRYIQFTRRDVDGYSIIFDRLIVALFPAVGEHNHNVKSIPRIVECECSLYHTAAASDECALPKVVSDLLVVYGKDNQHIFPSCPR